MAKKKHFTGVGAEKIHTSREGKCAKAPCVYRDNTPAAPEVPEPRQSHHAVPVSTTIGYKTDKDFRGYVLTIDAVYKKTEWCVNQKPNMKWLPLKGTYSKVKNNMVAGKRAARGQAPVWTMNLPCHDWDHNCNDGYTDEVEAALKEQVWNELKRLKSTGGCPDDLDMVAALQAVETQFQTALVERGQRESGTKAAIGKMGKGNWWLPFSMAKTKTARDRVVRAFGGGVEVKGLARTKK
jgi:hypothetical protein